MIGRESNRRLAGWDRLRSGAASIFAGKKTECPCCGSILKDSGHMLGLCVRCRNSIPWITDVLCPICGRYEECRDCVRRMGTGFRCSRSAVRYSPVMREWLARWKYRGDESLLRLFGDMLVHGYGKLLEVDGLQESGFACITYVPVHRERLMERGFDQAERLASELGRRVRLPVVPLLERVRHTSKQSFKTRAERLRGLEGAFAFAGRAAADWIGAESASKAGKGNLSGNAPASRRPNILLVDDVYTTGSTLQQCSLLLDAGMDADVYGLTWAR